MLITSSAESALSDSHLGGASEEVVYKPQLSWSVLQVQPGGVWTWIVCCLGCVLLSWSFKISPWFTLKVSALYINPRREKDSISEQVLLQVITDPERSFKSISSVKVVSMRCQLIHGDAERSLKSSFQE